MRAGWVEHLGDHADALVAALSRPAAIYAKIHRAIVPAAPWFGTRTVLQPGFAEDADSYFLDVASVFPVAALDVLTGQQALDLCAAPGGKSLLLASKLFPSPAAQLLCNDISAPRVARLRKNLAAYFPDHAAQIRVKSGDVLRDSKYIAKYQPFDRILLDAPCSSDRHRFAEDPDMKGWSLAAVRRTAKTQLELLKTAAAMLNKNGGRLVYSTCALAPEENDDVVRALLTRQPLFEAEEPANVFATLQRNLAATLQLLPAHGSPQTQSDIFTLRSTVHGLIILPYDWPFAGPIYMAVICKRKTLGVAKAS